MTEKTAPASTVAELDVPAGPARPVRQEQEPASDEITEVAPAVLRLQLPIDMPGLGHVNTFAIEDGDGFTLVDPGLPGKASWDALNQRLDSAGIPLARVHTVFVTHSHPDHFGGAGMLAHETGARIVTSQRFSTFLDQTDGLDERELEAAPFTRATPWGGEPEGPPPERLAEMRANMAEFLRWFHVPHPTLRLADSDPITVGGREWFALFTPGHTDDHLCLWDPTNGVMLSGDHVLPTITPHISGMAQGDPLAHFLESLDRVAAFAGVNVVLPAHGHPFTDLAGRVAAVKSHHADRLDRLREVSSELGWASITDISHQMFRPRSWGSMAESETYAHAEHLRLKGQAERREVESGHLEYLVI